jgi:hypothetical protein
MVTARLVLLCSCLLLVAHGAGAQDVFQFQVSSGSVAQGGDTIVVGRPGAPGAGLLSVEPFEGARPVLGAPYSADAVTTVTQLLANGNRIDNEMSAKVARDSRGRTRQEHQALFLGALVAERQAALVTITDPVAATYITLDQERRVAFRTRTPPVRATRSGGNMASATQATPPIPGRSTPPTAATATIPNTHATPMPSAPDDFNVSVGQGMSRGEAIAGRGFAVQAVPLGGDSVTKQLSEKEIEGVRVTGTLTTMTIPAERIGNQFPIEIVSERWFSPELQVVVMSRRSDPRFGDTVYRLINIDRSEPPQSLFEIPACFRIER